MAKNLAVNVLIGASLSGTFGNAFASASRTVGTLGKLGKELEKRQDALFDAMGRVRAPHLIEPMRVAYQRMGATIEEVKRKQEALNASLQRGAALRAQRADLRGQAFSTIATGAVAAAPIGLAVRQAAMFQDQMRDIAITGQLTAQEEAGVANTVRENAKKWGLAHAQLGEGVSALVAGGIQSAKELEAYAPSIAKSAVATKAAVGDVATTFLAFKDNLRIDAKDAEASFGMLAYTGKRGRFEVRDAAKWIPSLSPQYSSMGVTGKEAVAEIGAALQVARTGAGSSDEAANNFRNFLNKIMSQDTAKDFAGVGIDIQKNLEKAAAKGISPMEGMMDSITSYISTKGPKAGEAFKKALNIEDATKRAEAMDAVTSQYKLGELFQDQQAMGFVRSMMTHREEYKDIKQGALAAGSAAPGKGLLDEDAAKRLETFNGRLDTLKTGVVDIGITIGNALLPSLKGVVETATPAVNAIGRFAEAHPGIVSGAVSVGASLLGVKLAAIGLKYSWNLMLTPFNMFGTIAKSVSGKWTLLKASLQFGRLSKLGSVFSAAGGGVLKFGKALWGLVANPAGLVIAGIALAGYLVYKNWDKIGPVFNKAWSAVKEFASNAVNSISEFTDRTIGKTKMWLVRVLVNFRDFKQLAGQKISEAWNWIKEKFSAGIAYIKGLVGQFRAVGSAIIDGLVNGIKSKIAAARDAIVGLGQTIKSAITGALGIKSPSTVFANIGLMLGAGLVKGIGQSAPAVSHAMKQMATPPAVRFPPASDGSTGWQINPGRSRRTESAGGGPVSSGSTVVNLTQTFHIKGDAKDPAALKKSIAEAGALTVRELERVFGQMQHGKARTGYA